MVQVYDVTPFMDEHPGGDEVLLAATGKISVSNLPQSFIMYIYKAFCVALMDVFAL